MKTIYCFHCEQNVEESEYLQRHVGPHALVERSQPTYEQIAAILKGIDRDETETDDGWWETSTGAEFGSKKLEEIKALFL